MSLASESYTDVLEHILRTENIQISVLLVPMLSLENQINFKSTSVRIYLKIAMDVPIKIVESIDVKQYPLVICLELLDRCHKNF